MCDEGGPIAGPLFFAQVFQRLIFLIVAFPLSQALPMLGPRG